MGLILKSRKHHNNKGTRQIKTGNRAKKTQLFAKKIGVPFQIGNDIVIGKSETK
jgi:hypothetical protein